MKLAQNEHLRSTWSCLIFIYSWPTRHLALAYYSLRPHTKTHTHTRTCTYAHTWRLLDYLKPVTTQMQPIPNVLYPPHNAIYQLQNEKEWQQYKEVAYKTAWKHRRGIQNNMSNSRRAKDLQSHEPCLLPSKDLNFTHYTPLT